MNFVFALQSRGLLRCISYPFHVIRVGIRVKRTQPASFVIAVRRLGEVAGFDIRKLVNCLEVEVHARTYLFPWVDEI